MGMKMCPRCWQNRLPSVCAGAHLLAALRCPARPACCSPLARNKAHRHAVEWLYLSVAHLPSLCQPDPDGPPAPPASQIAPVPSALHLLAHLTDPHLPARLTLPAFASEAYSLRALHLWHIPLWPSHCLMTQLHQPELRGGHVFLHCAVTQQPGCCQPLPHYCHQLLGLWDYCPLFCCQLHAPGFLSEKGLPWPRPARLYVESADSSALPKALHRPAAPSQGLWLPSPAQGPRPWAVPPPRIDQFAAAAVAAAGAFHPAHEGV